MSEKECEKINFWKLLEKYEISIPRIQRDYAQGRKDEKTTEIREKLLNDIYKAILGEQKELELDFIYGRIIKAKENQNAICFLLDGQQRTTTLFLIYWYIAKRSNELEKEEVKNRLIKFSYNNRKNASEFCKKIIEKSKDINIDSLLKDKENQENEISTLIKNKLWFLVEWNNEPTIIGMLNMLDEIHKKFKDVTITKEIFQKMCEENIITMYLLETQKYNLPDELYIKMNSRGKDLSEYDIVKEKMISILKKLDQNLLNEFNKNIETNWNEFFFDYYSKNINLEDLDNSLTKLDNKEFLNLFYYITEMIYICNIASEEEIKNNKYNASPFNDEKKRIKYIEKTYDNEENVRLLFNILNIMESKENVKKYMQIYKKMPMFFIKEDEYNVIDRIIYGKDINDAEKEITFFYLIRLINKKSNNIEFIRMIRNLTQKNRYFDGTTKKYIPNPRYYRIKKDYEILKNVIISEDCYRALNDIKIEKNQLFGNFGEENIINEMQKYKYKNIEKLKYIENLDFTRGNINNFIFLINETDEDIKKFKDTVEKDLILTYMNMLKYNCDWIRKEDKYTYIGDKEEIYHTFTNDKLKNDIFINLYKDLKAKQFDLSRFKIINNYEKNNIYYYFIKYYKDFWENIGENKSIWFKEYNKTIKANWYKNTMARGNHINVFLNAVAKRNNYTIESATDINESGLIIINKDYSIDIEIKDDIEDNNIVIHSVEGIEKKIEIDMEAREYDYIEQIENAIYDYIIK